MLAQYRCWHTHINRGLAQLQRKPQQSSMPCDGMIMLYHHAMMQDLRILEHLLQVENRTTGDTLPMQDVYPIRCRPQAQFGFENTAESLPVCSA